VPSIAIVDCAGSANPEGTNPLVFQRCEQIGNSHVDGVCTVDYDAADATNTANCPAVHPKSASNKSTFPPTPTSKQHKKWCQTHDISEGGSECAWVKHRTCDPAPPCSDGTQNQDEKLASTAAALAAA
jgi:hypothetical protein